VTASMPLSPAKPNIWSKDRFSSISTKTCLIRLAPRGRTRKKLFIGRVSLLITHIVLVQTMQTSFAIQLQTTHTATTIQLKATHTASAIHVQAMQTHSTTVCHALQTQSATQ